MAPESSVWLGLLLLEVLHGFQTSNSISVSAPPNYADVVSEEEFSRHVPPYPQPPDCEGEACYSMFACIQEFRFQPPPLYSEVKKIKLIILSSDNHLPPSIH